MSSELLSVLADKIMDFYPDKAPIAEFVLVLRNICQNAHQLPHFYFVFETDHTKLQEFCAKENALQRLLLDTLCSIDFLVSFGDVGSNFHIDLLIHAATLLRNTINHLGLKYEEH